MLVVGAGQNQYAVNNSLRFRSSASAYLSKTWSTNPTDGKKCTFSFWIKRGLLTSSTPYVFHSGATNRLGLYFDGTTSNPAVIQIGTTPNYITSNNAKRDPSAWDHYVITIDTTQATAANRVKIYFSGVEASYASSTYPNQNSTIDFGANGVTNAIGAVVGGTNSFDGYLAEFNFIDGQALTPSSFGANAGPGNTWQPIRYAGTYGTNGFYLPFSDTSALTTTTNVGLGKDFSGNGNYWTTNNISITAGITYDAMKDSPTLTSATVANYATLNPLNKNSSLSPTDGNLSINIGVNSTSIFGTIGMSSGKWYWEVNIGTISSTAVAFGIATENAGTGNPFQISTTYGYGANATKWNAGASSAYGTTYTNGDVIGVAFDADAGTLTFYKNNTSQGIAFSSISSNTYFPYFGGLATSASNIYPNFGQRPFAYTPPTGYVALNTYNLPTPSLPQGNRYMDATVYTSNGTTQTITNTAGFKPDLVWTKDRASTAGNALNDSVRGAANYLLSYSTTTETNSPNFLTSFNSNGFSMGTSQYVNGNSVVGWQWQAGQGATPKPCPTVSLIPDPT